MIRTVHLVTGLDIGGAERMLVRLVSRMDPASFENHVVSLLPAGPLRRPLDQHGIPVSSLSMRRGRPNPWAIVRLARLLADVRPHILQTWLYHADVLGTLAARLARVRTIVWNVRASNVDRSHHGTLSALTRRAAARLSRLPSAVVVNSAAGRAAHEAIGYRPRQWVLIPNGIDCEEFAPVPAARRRLRRLLGVPESTPLVGLIARFHPMKDHETFVRAAGILCRSRPDVHFVLAGSGVNAANATLRQWLAAEGIADRVSLLGRCDDVAAIDAALDVAVMASSGGEGFPTAIAEAMACGVPCVATDVGDARMLVGDSGCVVPPRDAAALARGCQAVLGESPQVRQSRGLSARARILAEYDLARIALAYQQLYVSLVEA
jgi:glycosyltransferase involved in cell wall biosynthesis